MKKTNKAISLYLCAAFLSSCTASQNIKQVVATEPQKSGNANNGTGSRQNTPIISENQNSDVGNQANTNTGSGTQTNSSLAGTNAGAQLSAANNGSGNINTTIQTNSGSQTNVSGGQIINQFLPSPLASMLPDSGSPGPVPTPIQTPAVTPTLTPISTPFPTLTPSHSPTASPTSTSTPSSIPTQEPTPTSTPSPSPTPMPTLTPETTPTPTPVPTPVPTPTPSRSPLPIPNPMVPVYSVNGFDYYRKQDTYGMIRDRMFAYEDGITVTVTASDVPVSYFFRVVVTSRSPQAINSQAIIAKNVTSTGETFQMSQVDLDETIQSMGGGEFEQMIVEFQFSNGKRYYAEILPAD